MADLVLFDLDGTLSDSAPGILAALRHAFAVNGIAPLDAVTERSLLGPPFYESLPPIVGDDPQRLEAVIAAYRDYYRAGAMYDTAVYPGMTDVLCAARSMGARMAVATSKPEHFAVPIVERLGLSGFFDTVAGDDLDGSYGTKALVIAKALSRLGPVGAGGVVMVGDRAHDVIGARSHGIDCIGVRWGYASDGELEAAGAWTICDSADDLAEVLGLARGLDAAAS